MRNLKKLLAVIVSVCVLATFALPAFAAEKTAAEICEDLGVLKGDSSEGVTDTYLAKGTTRMQAALLFLRLIGKEDEALAFEGTESFSDADATWAAARPVLAYLKANPDLGWAGRTDGTFDPTAAISAQELYKVLLESLGYKQGTDFEWADVFTFAADKGLTLIADVTDLTNNDMATAIVEALKLTLKDSETTLIEDLVAKGVVTEAAAIAAGLIAAEPEELEVVDVTADNLKQFVVTFNKAVDSDDATDIDNYELDAENADVTGGSAALSEDGLSVTVTLGVAAADTEEDATLVVSGIADEDGNAMEEQEVEFTFNDVVFPTALSAEVIGNDTIKVKFSEPIMTFDVSGDDFEVDGGDYIIASEEIMNNDTEINVTLYSDLEEGTVELKVLNSLEDYAGYNVTKKTFEVPVVEDEDAPEIVGYKDATNTKVTLIFDNDIEIDDPDDDNFYHTNTKNKIGDDADEGFVEGEDYDLDGKELTLYFNENPMPDGTAYVYIAADAINDLWDNLNDKLVCKIEIEEDNTPPTLEDLEEDSETQITLTFSEDIEADSFDEDSFTILDSDGDVADVIDDASISGTDEIIIEFSEELDGEYTITIEEVEDLKGNEIEKVTKEFTMSDTTDPAFGDFEVTLYNASAEDQMIKVNFDEEMSLDGKYSVLDLEKYVLNNNGATIDLSDTESEVRIVAVDDNKAVEIYIASDEDDDDDFINIDATNADGTATEYDNVTLTIARVADSAGNYTVAAASAPLAVLTPSTVSFDAEATAVDTVVVTFDGKVSVDKDEFEIFVSADASYDGADVEVVFSKLRVGTNGDGDSTITYTLSNDIASDATSGASLYYVRSVVTESENSYGEPVADAFVEVADKIAPSLAEDEDEDGDDVDDVKVEYNGLVNAANEDDDDFIILTFTEAIRPNTISVSTFSVDDGDYEVITAGLDATGTILTLTVANDDNDNLEGVKVVQNSAIKDIDGNSVTGISTEVGEFPLVYNP